MSAKLPLELPWSDADKKWASILNPILSKSIVNGRLIENIAITTGVNVVDHKLGRTLVGWVPVRQSALFNLYDTQATNQMPQLTLNLVSAASGMLSLWVF